jgi:Family of unknown function (DUF6011)
MIGKKLNHSDVLKFMFAGKSTFTVLNTKSDNRFTFNIKLSKDGNLFFVKVLSGPDSYTYIGTCINGHFKHSKKSVISSDAQSVKVFDYIINKLKTNTLQDFIEIWHEGKCGKCGRLLTVPSSIETGLGPECLKRLSKQEKRDKFLELILS